MADEAFRKFYEAELAGSLDEIRRIRTQHARSSKRVAFVILIIFLILGVLLFAAPEDFSLLVLLGLGGCVVAWIICLFCYFGGGKEKRAFKEIVVPQIIKFFDPSLEFHPDRMVPSKLYDLSGLFAQEWDDYDGEDFVSGFCKGVEVMFSELKTEYETESTDDEGNTTRTTHTIFDGVFFVADFHKDFKRRTYVLPDVAEKYFGKLLGGFFQKCNVFQSGKLIKLENVEFEKEFAVYADDPVEARYILSPLLMERLLVLRKRFACPLQIAFVDSCMFIAISTKEDFFELSSLKNFDITVAEHCKNELEMFLKIVEELNLDRRIWSKQ